MPDAHAAIDSPRITALKMAIQAGDTGALDRFWQDVEASGAPLIERLANDDRHLLVTFVWRATRPTNHMAVIQDWGGTNRLEHQMHMQQLRGTDLWFASRRF